MKIKWNRSTDGVAISKDGNYRLAAYYDPYNPGIQGYKVYYKPSSMMFGGTYIKRTDTQAQAKKAAQTHADQIS